MGNEASTEAPQPAISNDLEMQWNAVAVSGSVPSSREGQCTGWISNSKKFLVFGGGCRTENSDPIQYNDLHVFDTESSTWSSINTTGVPPSSRTGACCAVVGNNMYIFGGLSTERAWLNDLFVFDTTQNSWNEITDFHGTSAPSPRDKCSACVIGKKIYIFGGFGPQMTAAGNPGATPVAEAASQEEEEEEDEEMEEEEEEIDKGVTFGWFNDLNVLDTETMTWTKLQPERKAPSPRAAFGMSVVGSQIYIMGGRDTSARVNDLHVLDVEKNSWVQPTVLGTKPVARSFHSCSVIGNKIIVVGGLGRDNSHLKDVHVFDIETNSWIQPNKVEGNGPSPRGFYSAVVVDQTLFMFGGSSEFDPTVQECKRYFNDVFSLKFVTHT